jgi:hypothetical protein
MRGHWFRKALVIILITHLDASQQPRALLVPMYLLAKAERPNM